jgi:hypothetical protein
MNHPFGTPINPNRERLKLLELEAAGSKEKEDLV